jgi:hypothetical protein
MRREEPYLGLTCFWYQPEREGTRKGGSTGAAWLSSARVVRCWVKSRNERNPRRMFYMSYATALQKREEGGDDVKSAWPLYPGRHTRYNGAYNGRRVGDHKQISQSAS